MNSASLRTDNHWNDLLDARWIDNLDQSLFLKRCRTGAVSLLELEIFSVQHLHYSRNFTRYLCALISNLSNDHDRFDLAENLFEELGLGSVGETPHSQIYRDMLASMKFDSSAHGIFKPTSDLVAGMFFYCRSPDPIDGLGAICLGAEAIVPHIYSQVIKGFKQHGFADDQLIFFHLHVENDDDHALTMKKIIEREVEQNPHKMVRLSMAAEDMIDRRRRFFNEITIQAEGHLTKAAMSNPERIEYAI